MICFNPETHSEKGGEWRDMDEIIKDIISTPFLSGVTFSGGAPWEQADKFAHIAKKLKSEISDREFDIWSYTGYKFEYILENKNKRTG